MKDILLIEDNRDDAEFLIYCFSEEEVNIINVRTSEEGLEYLKKDSHPSMIILDLNLPGISGFEFLEELKGDEDLKHIPVLVLSSSKSEEDIIKAYKKYANSYIRKPILIDDFIETAGKIRDYWFSLCKLPNHKAK